MRWTKRERQSDEISANEESRFEGDSHAAGYDLSWMDLDVETGGAQVLATSQITDAANYEFGKIVGGAMKIEYATHIGNRAEQEDRFIWADTPEGVLIGVADGHGGPEVADILEHHVERWWRAIDGDSHLRALQYVFKMAQASVWAYAAGSTLSLAFIQADQKRAHIGVIGDSPVIAERLRGDMFVAPEHNVRSNMEERSLAISRGGIYIGGYIWNGIGDNADGLQMSRALGDVDMGDILSHEPALMTVSLGDFLLVASDGLTDPKHTRGDTSTAIFDRIKAGMDTKALVDEAVALPTNDNATAILWRRS